MFNPFRANVSFQYPLKMTESQRLLVPCLSQNISVEVEIRTSFFNPICNYKKNYKNPFAPMFHFNTP